MNQELLFVGVCLIDLLLVLIAFRMGKPYLLAIVVGHILFTNMVSSKLITVFGLDGTVGNVFYAAIFLATDLLSEHYGKEEAYKSIKMGFVALMVLIIFGPFVDAFSTVKYTEDESNALSVIFGRTARIASASIIAYVISNLFDVWWYDKIQQRFKEKRHLYIRNLGSTTVSQLLDNTIFVLLAFSFTVSSAVLFQIWLAGYLIKVFVAFLDTPFMYFSFYFKPDDLREKVS